MNMCVNGLTTMSLSNLIIYIIILFLKKKKKKQRTCLFGKGVLSQRQRQFLQRDAGHVIVSPNILIL